MIIPQKHLLLTLHKTHTGDLVAESHMGNTREASQVQSDCNNKCNPQMDLHWRCCKQIG